MLAIYKCQSSSTSRNLSISAICYRNIPMEDSEVADSNDTDSTRGWRCKDFWSWKKIQIILAILTPIALSPLAFSSNTETRCGFVILWVAFYWVIEPVSISVTALLPVPLMPLLGILSSKDVSLNYMQEVMMMFLGGLGLAIAVEHCHLHERIALKVLSTMGSDTKWLMFGFMFTTMFLSMWISNTAATAMMVPIIAAVMNELKDKRPGDVTNKDKELHNLHKTLLLSIAYSANCGGTGTITGTSANMIFKGFMETIYPESYDITYASWMAYTTPGMILSVFGAWIVLQILYVPWWRRSNEETKERIKDVIESRYKELGRITFHEAAVLALFIFLVILWIFREPKFMTGWADLLASDKSVGDAVPAIGVLVLMFLLPAEPWKLHNSPPLLTWKVMQEKMPWGLLLLLGGGYALADGAKAKTNQVNPIYLMLPVTISASFAFMMPAATGPNAIIFGTNILRVPDMLKPGIIMNIIAVCVQLFMIHTVGVYLFSVNTFPQWANESIARNS